MIELAKPSKEEWQLAREEWEETNRQEIAKFEKQKNIVFEEGALDDDGYPTDNALELIQNWHHSDILGLFRFIESIWHLRSWGWTETDGGIDEWTNETLPDTTKRFHISTAGWSGNESIIHALKKSSCMIWSLTFVQERRGGHYIFEVKNDA